MLNYYSDDYFHCFYYVQWERVAESMRMTERVRDRKEELKRSSDETFRWHMRMRLRGGVIDTYNQSQYLNIHMVFMNCKSV